MLLQQFIDLCLTISIFPDKVKIVSIAIYTQLTSAKYCKMKTFLSKRYGVGFRYDRRIFFLSWTHIFCFQTELIYFSFSYTIHFTNVVFLNIQFEFTNYFVSNLWLTLVTWIFLSYIDEDYAQLWLFSYSLRNYNIFLNYHYTLIKCKWLVNETSPTYTGLETLFHAIHKATWRWALMTGI